jgi:hypothetical protein
MMLFPAQLDSLAYVVYDAEIVTLIGFRGG